MLRRKVIALGILCVLSLALSISLVNAAGTAEVASVWAEDGSGNKLNVFNPGDTVTIKWHATYKDGTTDAACTVDIKIVKTDGSTLVTLVTGGATPDGSTTWTAVAGYYYIVCEGAVSYVYPIAVASIFILPESALGTLMATTAGFAAFGTIAIVKRKRAGNKT
jgi:hypothetical protein